MATNKRDGSRAGKRVSGGRNNNPDGHNQYSGATSTMRDNPLATAVALGGAVAAGVFLWSRRNQISDQIGSLADQINEWREGTASDSAFTARNSSAGGSSGASDAGARKQTEIAEEALTLKELGQTS
jgi:hypothetical protein